ncbi:uncharacterized protein PHALS_12785 [Plasmopara halstedii]|uniref:Uncharacterized protein n=1 Tax=Plasmopara halstedii TaxID=4781 RepID=A0A0P1AMG6_PLAHL|nr:uncharacterized protein PHALS_12785 [Plasmopara halstedii]CEG42517.1 hypothetical protein PHALS_12785 [Plasmopara halstedii]|eukprot:XP_024578886.1 hypothetical protein PHALS_12785 [Plasmopara halstedii]
MVPSRTLYNACFAACQLHLHSFRVVYQCREVIISNGEKKNWTRDVTGINRGSIHKLTPDNEFNEQ